MLQPFFDFAHPSVARALSLRERFLQTPSVRCFIFKQRIVKNMTFSQGKGPRFPTHP